MVERALCINTFERHELRVMPNIKSDTWTTDLLIWSALNRRYAFMVDRFGFGRDVDLLTCFDSKAHTCTTSKVMKLMKLKKSRYGEGTLFPPTDLCVLLRMIMICMVTEGRVEAL